MIKIQEFLTNSSEVSESNRLSNEERGAGSHSDSGDKSRVLEDKPKFDKLTIRENSFEISMKIITPLLIGGTHVHEIVLKPLIHKGWRQLNTIKC
ncbi:hypothetical protein SAG0027_09145 [Streptococcus agalactiae FSL S3-251]|nr:hypothetical protein SAG0029_01885 [Streptococcus agalactiae FSL S3-501]EPV95703.1 hypothetical protein SAG0027_09145 [Streptococcus agalactiae FSL S3-251]KLL34892.1 hypothetical protein WA03_05850 [Streptococcus agalactiae]